MTVKKSSETNYYNALPSGRLGLIALQSCTELGRKVNDYLVEWRRARDCAGESSLYHAGYYRDNYLISHKMSRFGTGEGKGTINDSIRGDDMFILVDICNYSITYRMFGYENRMSPDDHFGDLKRVIAAIGGKARRINVIMPFLYESRQNVRNGRESLDCALALQELVRMGVENIITFDAHDPRVQNAIPRHGFETVTCSYQFIKNILRYGKDVKVDSEHLMVISPDEAGMKRSIYLANNLGVDMGMVYRRRDYSTIVNGRNPIVAHEFLGTDVEGKDMIIMDDMLSSGNTLIEVSSLLKKMGARNIYFCATFGMFTNGLERINQAYKEGLFTNIFTTNLVYQRPELQQQPYYHCCDLSKYIALLIDTLNHDTSISDLLDPAARIQKVLRRYANGEEI